MSRISPVAVSIQATSPELIGPPPLAGGEGSLNAPARLMRSRRTKGKSQALRMIARSVRDFCRVRAEFRLCVRRPGLEPVMRPHTRILYSLCDRITGEARGARQKDTGSNQASEGSAGYQGQSPAEPLTG